MMKAPGTPPAALDQLERVLETVMRPMPNWIAADNDFDPIRDLSRFKSSIAEAERRLA